MAPYRGVIPILKAQNCLHNLTSLFKNTCKNIYLSEIGNTVRDTVEVVIFAGNLFSLYSRGHRKREIKFSLMFMWEKNNKAMYHDLLNGQYQGIYSSHKVVDTERSTICKIGYIKCQSLPFVFNPPVPVILVNLYTTVLHSPASTQYYHTHTYIRQAHKSWNEGWGGEHEKTSSRSDKMCTQ